MTRALIALNALCALWNMGAWVANGHVLNFVCFFVSAAVAMLCVDGRPVKRYGMPELCIHSDPSWCTPECEEKARKFDEWLRRKLKTEGDGNAGPDAEAR